MQNNQTEKKASLLMKYKGLWIALALVLILGWRISGTYNRIAVSLQGVEAQWSEVENQYQRRHDLIPNLVNTVKGYASHEKETLQAVIEARSKATSTQIDANNLTPESLATMQASQEQLSQALSRLMVVVEKYPELKADTNFRQLQAQLEGTENRIAVARRDFNQKAEGYNVQIVKFPTNIVAKLFGFAEKPFFKAQEKADVAPVVEF